MGLEVIVAYPHALALTLGLAAACVDPPTAPTAPAAEERARRSPQREVEELLRARHPEDLPSRATLERVEGVGAVLRGLATGADELIVRARAAEALGQLGHEEDVPFLVALAQDTTQHGKVRAAAIIGLGHVDLAGRSEAIAMLGATARAGDPRLGPEAASVIAASPAAAALRDELRADVALTPAVKAALNAALEAPR